MKRYIRAAESKMSLSEILDTEYGRHLIDSIEEAENEVRDRGIDIDDPNNVSEFWLNALKNDCKKLYHRFGYVWDERYLD